MNIGIREAKGEYIIRLDAHSSYPKDYFSKLIYWHKKLNAGNVGAVWNTDVLHKTNISIAIRNVLSDKFGVGGAKFRIGVRKIEEVDTVPFGCYNKKIFEQIGLYDERLVRNQDIELNKRLRRNGKKIYLIPDIKSTYYARENFINLAKNNYENGKWNILTAFYTKSLKSLSLRHFIPLIFIGSIFAPLLIGIFYPYFILLTLLSLSSYLALVIIVSIKIKNEDNSYLYLVQSFLTLHLSYGLGSVAGVFSVLTKLLRGNV